MKRINKKGQMGMSFIVGILVAVISLVFFMALQPAISDLFGVAKGSDSANCKNYIDPNGIYSYNSSRNTDTLSCTALGFGPGVLILAVILGIIAGIIYGNFGKQKQQPQYQQYGGY
jgi:uncharacterized protein YneF (UPF0154 family)